MGPNNQYTKYTKIQIFIFYRSQIMWQQESLWSSIFGIKKIIQIFISLTKNVVGKLSFLAFMKFNFFYETRLNTFSPWPWAISFHPTFVVINMHCNMYSTSLQNVVYCDKSTIVVLRHWNTYGMANQYSQYGVNSRTKGLNGKRDAKRWKI